jgi:nucleoside 2-deoxyribosyltransferase
MLDGYTYIASPYTDEDNRLRQKRYEAVCAVCAHYTDHGVIVFSPIAHWHPIAANFKLPKHFDFWSKLNFTFIERADSLIVAKIDGWDKSKGVKAEVEYALTLGKEVEYFNMEHLHG